MKKLFVKFLAVVVMAVTGALGASAENFPSDGSAVTLGTVYDLVFGQSYNATITAPSTGTLIQDGGSYLLLEGAGERTSIGYGELGQVFAWNVEEGKTYTVATNFMMDGGKVRFDMEESMGLSVVSISPAEGGELTITKEIVLTFNSTINYSTAYLAVGDTQEPVSKNPSLNNVLAFDASGAMTSLYNSGKISKDGGEEITLVVTGVVTTSGIKYGTDGTLEVKFVAAPRQVDLLSYNIPLPMKSYYAPGDPAGILTFTFDNDIRPDGVNLTIFYGEKGLEGDYYLETVPGKVDGAVVTVDLTGKLRDINAYISSADPLIELKLNGIFDLDGRPAVGSSASSYASYTFNVGYDYIAAENVACEFIPATGSSLAGIDEIEIWFNKSNIFNYDGVEFLYTDGGEQKSVVVAKADLDIQTSGDETTIHVAVPAEVKGKPCITVQLHNLTSLDGYNHYIMAEYDKFVVSIVSPIQPGQALASTGDEDFVFDVYGAEKYFYLRYDFYNAEGAEGWVYGSDLNKAEDGTWTAYNGNFPCFNNYEPRMVVSAYYTSNDFYQDKEPAETYEFFFHGTQIPFSYSDVKFESIDPEPNTELVLSDDLVFTVTFDGLVRIDTEVSGVVLGMGAGMLPFKKIEPVFGEFDEGGEYANTWKLYPETAVLADRTSVEISIKAYDEEGKLVEGNMGGEEYDYLAFEYPLTNLASLVEVNVAPAAGYVAELADFTVWHDSKPVGVNYGYTGDEQVRIISNNGGRSVINIDRDDMKVVSEQTGVDELGNPIYSEYTHVEFSVSPAITEEGEYTLIIPANYFIVGDQFDTHGNAEAEIEYTIGTPVEPTEHVLTLSPEPGEVSALTRIDITADEIEEAVVDFENGVITITDAEGKEVYSITAIELDATAFDYATWEFLGYYIEPNITEPGVYTVNIPEGMFFFNEDEPSQALTAVYTVGTTSLTMVTVETAAEYTVYTISGVKVLTTANAADLSTLRPGLYIINGKKTLVK